MDSLLNELTFHNNREVFEDMRNSRKEDFEHFVYKYKDLASAEEFESFINVLKKMQVEGNEKI